MANMIGKVSVLCAMLSFAGVAAVQGEFTYTTNSDNTLTITGYSGPGGSVILPSMIDGQTVTVIASDAFIYTSASSVTFPDSILSIDAYAFEECGIASVTIGAGVTNLGNPVFDYCPYVNSITVSQSNLFYSSLDGVLFDKSKSTLIQYPQGKSGPFVIPDTATSIDANAFNGARGLTAVSIPNGVTNIGMFAFWNCSSLTSVVIPFGVSNIPNLAFDGCGLTNVVIPHTVTNIDVQAFMGCPLNTLSIPDSVTTIGAYAFDGCGMTNIEFGSGLSSIGGSAFERCGSLLSVVIPDSVTSLAGYSFMECTGLGMATIPGTVGTLSANTFNGCTSLTNVTIEGGVTSINSGAFFGCSTLPTVFIPSTVTNIASDSFSDCSSLSSFAVDAANSFYNSTNGVLFDVNQVTLICCPEGRTGGFTIPETVTSIGAAAFFSSSLTSISIPESVTNIGDSAFQGSYLTNIIIPGSVANIPSSAFYGCGDLTNITILNGIGSIGDSAFWMCSSLVSVRIPDSVGSVGSQAFFVCRSLTNVFLGHGVTNLSDFAFFNCPSLTTVFFSGDAPAEGSDVFEYDPVTAYYQPLTAGWSSWGGSATALWAPVIRTASSGLGMQSNQFGFYVTGGLGIPIVLEVCTNLANPLWVPVQSTTATNNSVYFNESFQSNVGSRFYRIAGP